MARESAGRCRVDPLFSAHHNYLGSGILNDGEKARPIRGVHGILSSVVCSVLQKHWTESNRQTNQSSQGTEAVGNRQSWRLEQARWQDRDGEKGEGGSRKSADVLDGVRG